MNKMFLAVTAILVCISCLLSSCQINESHPDESNHIENTSKDTSEGTMHIYGGETSPDDPWNTILKIPSQSERDKLGLWNLEVTFEKYDDDGIHITIFDHDNLGFVFSQFYYILEVQEDGRWKKITTMNESQASYQEVYAIPQSDTNYIHLINEVCMSSLLPSNTQLQPGHYRVTKVLSGREFSVEFDLD